MSQQSSKEQVKEILKESENESERINRLKEERRELCEKLESDPDFKQQYIRELEEKRQEELFNSLLEPEENGEEKKIDLESLNNEIEKLELPIKDKIVDKQINSSGLLNIQHIENFTLNIYTDGTYK